MRSMVSTCPRAGARCYPPLLGITKEIMSQGPQILDMEYGEPDRLDHGPGRPIFSSFQRLHFVSSNKIHHLSLVLYQRWFFLHEVMSLGIMLCVTLILKRFEYVDLVIFVSNGFLDIILIHLTMSGGNDRMF